VRVEVFSPLSIFAAFAEVFDFFPEGVIAGQTVLLACAVLLAESLD
jgi:hypothetical protein